MLVFSANSVDAVSIMRALNRYNGSDIEISINSKPFSVTFMRSSATGNTEQDELQVEYVWKVPNTKVLSQTYDMLRKSINNDSLVRIGTVEFRAQIMDTTTFPTGTDLDEMLSSKFAISFSKIHSATQIKESAAKKRSGYIFLQVPDNINSLFPLASDKPRHITISYLEDIDKDTEEKVKATITTVATRFSGFVVKTSGMEIFGPDNKGYAYVTRVECPTLVRFKEELDTLLYEIDPALVSTKYPDYRPHITLMHDKKKDLGLLAAKPMAWTATCVYFDIEDEIVLEQKFSLTDRGNTVTPNLEIKDAKELKQAGYYLAEELDKLDYPTSANVLRTIVGTIDSSCAVTAKLRLTALEIEDKDLSSRCLRIANELDTSLDTRIRNALEPYVAPEKLDVAMNAVIESLDSEGSETEALGPGSPGTDPHIVTYVKAPQTMDVPSGASSFSKNLEFSKRNY